MARTLFFNMPIGKDCILTPDDVREFREIAKSNLHTTQAEAALLIKKAVLEKRTLTGGHEDE